MDFLLCFSVLPISRAVVLASASVAGDGDIFGSAFWEFLGSRGLGTRGRIRFRRPRVGRASLFGPGGRCRSSDAGKSYLDVRACQRASPRKEGPREVKTCG